MSVTRYYSLAMMQSVGWLRECMANPSTGMRAIHVRIIRLAIAHKEGAR